MAGDEWLTGWRRLGCAILLRAWRDAHTRNGHQAARKLGLPPGATLAGDARAFLASEGARWLVAALDLDQAGFEHALAELPPAAGRCWKAEAICQALDR